MKLAAAVALALALSCGAARPTGAAGERTLVHDDYTFSMRTRVTLAGDEIASLRTELHVHVLERGRRGGARLALGMERTLGDGSMARGVVEARVDRRGRITTEPTSSCTDRLPDFHPVRTARHALDALSPWVGHEGVASSELAEISEVISLEGQPIGRASVSARATTLDVAGWTFEPRGEIALRTRRRLDPRDAFVGRSELVLEMSVRATDPTGVEHEEDLRIETDLVAEGSELAAIAPCDELAGAEPVAGPARPPPDEAIPRLVTAIEARRADITTCYERQLATTPTLTGLVSIQLRVQPDGSVSDATVVEDSVGDPQVGACVAEILRHVRISPGPAAPTTYQFPFVFTPSG